MIEWIKEMVLTPWIALLLYGLPLVLCVIGYIGRTFRDYRRDVRNRDTWDEQVRTGKSADSYYFPELTIGTIIGRALVAILPVGNLIAAIFDVAPKLFDRLFDWIERIFDQPLVPKRRTVPKQDKDGICEDCGRANGLVVKDGSRWVHKHLYECGTP